MNQNNSLTSVDYQDYLITSLKDRDEAIAYLNAALSEDEDSFLLALHNVATAWGFSNLAEKSGLDRAGLYRMLSASGNPKLKSLTSLLRSMGLSISITKDPKHSAA